MYSDIYRSDLKQSKFGLACLVKAKILQENHRTRDIQIVSNFFVLHYCFQTALSSEISLKNNCTKCKVNIPLIFLV